MKADKKVLGRKFYEKDTLTAARELLGCVICVRHGGTVRRAEIIETEAYCGVADLACHASKGRTKRTEIMFGPAGFAYVYMIYGMYFCLNFVTEKEGSACAVLIRGVRSERSGETGGIELKGPGKTCRFLNIDKSYNGLDLTTGDMIWTEKRTFKKVNYITDKRIGIDYAGEYKDKPWRFILVNSV
ncbi:MAG TPA: 3-methyladenine DNA glycosylase [Candidatus Wallbacteria bacterium]|nr:3-methyladenine DNA glycosylase [Candidatus Wallbacteria bacterium]